MRVLGPNVTRGYFGSPDATRKAFDEEGYFLTRDAGRFMIRRRPGQVLSSTAA